MTYTDSLKTKVKEVMISDILGLMEQDVIEPLFNQVAYSQEDMKFLSLLEKGVKFQDGHYELPLLFRNGSLLLLTDQKIDKTI